MKNNYSKKEIEEKIREFFQKESFTADETKKIKKLAMKSNIKLGVYRRKFCRKCFYDLRNGSVRINNSHKNVECLKCGFANKLNIKTS